MSEIITDISFGWGIPLMYINYVNPDLTGVNGLFTILVCIITAGVGFLILAEGPKKGYRPLNARIGYGFIMIALMVWIFGIVPLFALFLLSVLLWAVGWEVIIKWFIWGVLIKNAIVALPEKKQKDIADR